jgi:hypothetical protein
VSQDGLTFAYGFDSPLSEYFLSLYGPARKVTEFVRRNGLSESDIACDDDVDPDSDEQVDLHLVGCLSGTPGERFNFLNALWKFNLHDLLPSPHVIHAGLDLPF